MISVVLATYNEEKNLESCLQSVKSFADEIVVVDGDSTDETRGIAKRLGARVIQTTNKTNFHINKQMAIDEARGDLILQLDADEHVDAELAKFIVNLQTPKTTQKNQEVAWWIKRNNYFLGAFLKKGGQYPDPVIRLFIRGCASLPQKDVHEQMIVNGRVGRADGHLIHYGNPTFADYLRKFNTYTSFKADQLMESKVEINILNTCKYLCFKPLNTFVSLFFRHKGFVDGIPGFVFALMSGIHHQVAYLKLWEKYYDK